MSYYVIIEITIQDKNLYSEYIKQVYDIVTQHGGTYLARGGNITAFSGNWHPERMILIEFEDKQQIQNCFQSPEYREIANLREQSTISRAIIVKGCETEEPE